MNSKELLKKVRKIDIITNKKVDNIFAGNFKSSFYGNGLEFADIREYDVGDDWKYIDWYTTARQGKPFIKRYVESRQNTVLVILDISASMKFGSTADKTKKDKALEALSLILFSVFKNSDSFGLVLFSNDIEFFIPPSNSHNNLMKCLSISVEKLFREENYSSDQKSIFDFLNINIKKKSLCFFISDHIQEDYYKKLSAVAKRHEFIFFRIHDSIENGILPDEIIRVADIETGEKSVFDFTNKRFRKNFLNMMENRISKENIFLVKNKIKFVDISTEDDVYMKLLNFFKTRQKKYNSKI